MPSQNRRRRQADSPSPPLPNPGRHPQAVRIRPSAPPCRRSGPSLLRPSTSRTTRRVCGRACGSRRRGLARPCCSHCVAPPRPRPCVRPGRLVPKVCSAPTAPAGPHPAASHGRAAPLAAVWFLTYVIHLLVLCLIFPQIDLVPDLGSAMCASNNHCLPLSAGASLLPNHCASNNHCFLFVLYNFIILFIDLLCAVVPFYMCYFFPFYRLPRICTYQSIKLANVSCFNLNVVAHGC